MIDYDLISKPVFISGHPRSGTNLLMRMIDGSSDIVVPPGEGKLQILRRFATKPHGIIYNSKDALKIFSQIELNMSDENENKFLKLLEFELEKNGKIDDILKLVNVLVFTILNYNTSKRKHSAKRWLEKNHNLEFYWGRAKSLFANPKLIYVVRDPRDVWVSWNKYCLENKLPNDLDQARINIQNHMLNEVIEWSYKINRFSTRNDFIQYYNIDLTSINQLIDMLMSAEINKYNREKLISIDEFRSINNPAGRFAWNYFIMLQRATWLAKEFDNDVMLIRYEDIVLKPQESISQILSFCDLHAGELNGIPTEQGKLWVANSSFNSGKTNQINSSSVGRWKNTLDQNDINVIENITYAGYSAVNCIN